MEPGYESSYPPLGLMKISTWHKQRGDFVDFVKFASRRTDSFLGGKLLNDHFDLIYITSLFTYQADEVISAIHYCRQKYPQAVIKVGGIMATLLPDYIMKETGVEPHLGLLEGAEDCSPDYKLFPNLRCSITFTTRGCRRSCEFCAVKKHEPKFFVKENWEKDIDLTKNRIVFWDNNWLYSPNFVRDIEKLKKLNKPFDFNQGLDCRLFDAEKAALLSRIMIRPLRFAFDNHSEEGYIQNAIKLAQKYGFKDIRVYVLYNSPDRDDTPEYFFHRIKELNKLGALSYPMRFRPLDSIRIGKVGYVSPNWDTFLLRGLKLTLMFYYTKGMIRKSRQGFTSIYGNDEKQFRERLYRIHDYDRELGKQRSRKTAKQMPLLTS